MNLRKRSKSVPAVIQPKRIKAIYSIAPIRKPEVQHKLNTGRRQVPHSNGGWLRKRLPGLEVKYIERFYTDDMLYLHARQHHTQRLNVAGDSFTLPFLQEHINQLVQIVKNQMWKISGYLKTKEGTPYAGKKWMEDMLRNSKAPKIQKIAKILEKMDPLETLPAPKLQTAEFQANNKCLVTVESKIWKTMKGLKSDYFFDFLNTNVIDLQEFEADFAAGFKALEKFEKIFKCNCKNGKCDTSCMCYQINALFTDNVTDPHFRRKYSCSELCKCQGKCSKSFPAPPPNNAKIVYENSKKGCVMIATQYSGTSESIIEFKGDICDETKIDDLDEYAYQAYTAGIDGPVLDEVFNSNRKNGKKVKALSTEYEDLVKRISNINICLDPRKKSNEARYMSHACFPNCRATHVYSKGLNPAKLRIMMTSLLPIYPGQEYTFFYSLKYCCEQLKNVCLCKHLCCVRNVNLFPFITDEHIKQYYGTLYEHLHREYMKRMPKNQ